MKFCLNSFDKNEKRIIAGIVADLMGDGHLQKPPKNRFDYTSKSIEELDRFAREIYLVFIIKGKIRRCSTNKYLTYNYGINNKDLALFLGEIGVPRGNKVLISFKIPKWILEEKYLFARFINRLFSCEASVDIKYRAIDFNMYKSLSLIEDGFRFFNQIKNNLEKHYQIRTTNAFLSGKPNLRKDGIFTKCIRLKIKNIESLKLYNDYIGFDDENKKRKLKELIENN